MKPISGKAMCRVLQSLGWVCVRSKGSHFRFVHPARPGVQITVPAHSYDLRRGTQKQIMNDAGLRDEDF